ncbi:MAG: 3-isopropylmalate dehydratase [Tissierellia bacterium]|nr:3-isopropylmalate dehydratase [Tissierellia bacterium]
MNKFGVAHKLGDNINTDYIIPAKRKRDSLDMKEISKYLLEDLDPTLRLRIKEGDFLVAGWNFGCGSSREVAPRVIINAGIKAVIAKSFGRIFYRNAISTGLILFECDTVDIDESDELDLDLKIGQLTNITKSIIIKGRPLPKIMLDILESGGLVKYLEKEGTLSV